MVARRVFAVLLVTVMAWRWSSCRPLRGFEGGGATASCHRRNIHDMEFATGKAFLFFVVSPDCRLVAWKEGHKPDEPFSFTEDETGSESMSGFSSFAGDCDDAIAFLHRTNEGRELVVIFHSSASEFKVVRLNMDIAVEKTGWLKTNLLEFKNAKTISLRLNFFPIACAFTEADLHCFVKGNNEFRHVNFAYDGISYTKTSSALIEGDFGDVSAWALSASSTGQPMLNYMNSKIKGWMYEKALERVRDTITSKIVLHQVPIDGGSVKRLVTVDEDIFIMTRCDVSVCRHYWIHATARALSPFTCVVATPHPVILGIVSDLFIPEIPTTSPAVPILPVGAAAAALHSRVASLVPVGVAGHQYWPIILLIAFCLLILLVVLVLSFVYESVGFKRRFAWQQRLNDKYGKLFWPDRGEEVGVTLLDSYMDSGPDYAEDETEAAQTQARSQTLRRKSEPPPQKKKKKELLFTEEENNTPSSLKSALPRKKKKTTTPIKGKSEHKKGKSKSGEMPSRLLFTEEENRTPPSLKSKSKPSRPRTTPKAAVAVKGKESKKGSKKPEPFHEVRMSTHAATALNQKRKHRKGAVPVPNVTDDFVRTPSAEHVDVAESLKLNALSEEPLPSTRYPEKGRKRKKRKSKEPPKGPEPLPTLSLKSAVAGGSIEKMDAKSAARSIKSPQSPKTKLYPKVKLPRIKEPAPPPPDPLLAADAKKPSASKKKHKLGGKATAEKRAKSAEKIPKVSKGKKSSKAQKRNSSSSALSKEPSKKSSAASKKSDDEKESESTKKPTPKEPSKKVAKEPSKKRLKEPSKKAIKEASKKVAKEPSKKVAKEPSKKVTKEPSHKAAPKPPPPPSKEPSKKGVKEPSIAHSEFVPIPSQPPPHPPKDGSYKKSMHATSNLRPVSLQSGRPQAFPRELFKRAPQSPGALKPHSLEADMTQQSEKPVPRPPRSNSLHEPSSTSKEQLSDAIVSKSRRRVLEGAVSPPPRRYGWDR